jgi:probable phosphoglycerate mutase
MRRATRPTGCRFPAGPYSCEVPEIVVVRHGETEWSAAGRHTGRTDLPLTEQGERAAAALRPLLAERRFGLVLASPLKRAQRTAELAGLRPDTDADLAEWDYGAYDGRTTAEISEELGRPWSVWSDGVVDGESLGDVALRVRRVIDRARPVLDQGSDVALVGHGHALRVLAACWLELAPAEGSRFVLRAGAVGTLGFEHSWPAITGWNVGPHPAG